MRFMFLTFLLLASLLFSVSYHWRSRRRHKSSSKSDPPMEFAWGSATSSYQTEGAITQGGRGPSIWDTFSAIPGKIYDNQTGAVADRSYEFYPEDISLVTAMGVKYYRMSISWSRIVPSGKRSSKENKEGIDHYKKLFEALKKASITPLVTLYHWDLPQGIQDEYLGWLSPEIEEDFLYYADLCFKHFGDSGLVKYWATVNEPWTFCYMGYVVGSFAPGRCSDRSTCPHGNSSTEGYTCAHNVLNTHARVVELYRSKYAKKHHGKIGIVLNMDYAEPLTDSEEDMAAAERRRLFAMGWFADPIFFGSYPEVMVQRVGSRLPEFTEAQRRRLIGSWDIFFLNHYTTNYYSNTPVTYPNMGWDDDCGCLGTPYNINGTLIGPQAESSWLYVVPRGIYQALMWNHKRYSAAAGADFPFFITENGVDVPGEATMPINEALNDTFRISYYSEYLSEVRRAIDDGVNVRGYFAWSLLDNFEWADGYSCRFGLHYVDYNATNRVRYTKNSAKWFANLTASNRYFNPVPITKLPDSGLSLSYSNSGSSSSNTFSSWFAAFLPIFLSLASLLGLTIYLSSVMHGLKRVHVDEPVLNGALGRRSGDYVEITGIE